MGKIENIIKRLNRYSAHAITHALDEDFALAVNEAKTELEDLRNELCLKCGRYKLDYCGECRWKSGC